MKLPNATFFKPKEKFFEIMTDLKGALLEVGCGAGYALMKTINYGEVNNVPHMQNARGFDLYEREEPFVRGIVVGYDINDNFPFNHERFTILVCRPDHGGWFSEALEAYLDGDRPCTRVIYVGKPCNVTVDLTQSQIDCVTTIHEDVGEDGEVMMIWSMR